MPSKLDFEISRTANERKLASAIDEIHQEVAPILSFGTHTVTTNLVTFSASENYEGAISAIFQKYGIEAIKHTRLGIDEALKPRIKMDLN